MGETKMMPDKLVVELTAAIVDKPATPASRTKVEIILENSVGRLSVTDSEGGPRSVHRFTLRDATDLGCGGVHNLTVEQAAQILGISCSLTNPIVLFSPLQPQQLRTSLELAEVPSQVEVVETGSRKDVRIAEAFCLRDSVSTVLGQKLRLDERRIFDVVGRLLIARVFDTSGRDLLMLNVLEAIKSYVEALMSVGGLSCYSSLYNSFEKAVNADGERKGNDFDAAASAVTGLKPKDVEGLRLFNNRLKHALRNKEDFAALKATETQFAQLVKNLKSGADSAILSWI